MNESDNWYVKTADGKVYGPASVSSLIGWAKDGRIQPTGFLSQDRKVWMPAQKMRELEMRWLVETEPGKVFGPFNRAVVIQLFKDGSAPADAKVYALHDFPPDVDPPPQIVEKIVEKVVEKEVRVEVPVEKIVEKIVVKEVRVEVPVEKIVEKVIEVEPPPRREVVDPVVVEPVDRMPPRSPLFGNLDRDRLAALEAAAQRELAKSGRMGAMAGLFGRRRG